MARRRRKKQSTKFDEELLILGRILRLMELLDDEAKSRQATWLYQRFAPQGLADWRKFWPSEWGPPRIAFDAKLPTPSDNEVDWKGLAKILAEIKGRFDYFEESDAGRIVDENGNPIEEERHSVPPTLPLACEHGTPLDLFCSTCQEFSVHTLIVDSTGSRIEDVDQTLPAASDDGTLGEVSPSS